MRVLCFSKFLKNKLFSSSSFSLWSSFSFSWFPLAAFLLAGFRFAAFLFVVRFFAWDLAAAFFFFCHIILIAQLQLYCPELQNNL